VLKKTSAFKLAGGGGARHTQKSPAEALLEVRNTTMSDSDIEANLQLLDEGGVRNTHIVFNDKKKCRTFLELYSTRSASPAEIPDITEGSATQVRAYYRERSNCDLEPLPPRELNVDETVHGLIQHYGLFRPVLLPKTAAGEAPSDAAVSEKKR
jgi:hypothetical protein